MNKIIGVGACGGIAMGKLQIFDNTLTEIPPLKIENTQAELVRFHAACKSAIQMIEELCNVAIKKVGPDESLIFSIHEMILKDQTYIQQVESAIVSEHFCAEYAVQQSGKQFAMMLHKMENHYISERSADIVDVTRRVIQILSGKPARSVCEKSEPFILAAPDLLPSEVIQMDKSKVLAVFTSRGSKTSHAAILSRKMGIPAVVGTGIRLNELQDGQTIIVDGTKGIVIQNPDEIVISSYKQTSLARGNTLYRMEQLAGETQKCAVSNHF